MWAVGPVSDICCVLSIINQVGIPAIVFSERQRESVPVGNVEEDCGSECAEGI